MNHQSNNKPRLLSISLTTWIIVFAALLLIVFAIWSAFFSKGTFDQKIFDCIDPQRTDGRTRFVRFITWGGNTFFLIAANVLLLLFFVFKKNKWLAITVAAIAISSVGLMSLLKNVIHRVRPSGGMVEGVTNFSFPSGHSFMSVAFYGIFIWWAAISIKNKWQKGIAVTFLVLLILLIGFTRIYLRMHYATDVIAGFCMGTIWVIIVLAIIDTIQAKYKAKMK
jgi:membrane-associated phospholipid phosphatase